MVCFRDQAGAVEHVALLVAAVLTAACVWLAPCSAHANGPNITSNTGWKFQQDKLYLPVGLTTGATVRSGGAGYLLGAELSLAKLWAESADFTWAGLFVDGMWDFGEGVFHTNMGPELGWRFIGLDGGYALEAFGPHGVRHGAQARVVLSVALLSLYARGGMWFGDRQERWGQFGVLIKVPIPID